MSVSKDTFLTLVRLGIGHYANPLPERVDWVSIQTLAGQQGLSAIVIDGIEKLPEEKRPPKMALLQWIGEVLQNYESRYAAYQKTITEMAVFYNTHGFKMMVLKGYACSLEWPKPDHRPCGDIDIWQFGKQKEADKALVEKGIKVDKSHHHHTVFQWREFTIENHYDFINVHHHYSHRGLEAIFKELGEDDSYSVEVQGERVYLPSPNLHALFLLRHALNHFASLGINLRQVLDWAFYIEKHSKEIDWVWLEKVVDEYHMRDFYNSLNAICVEDLGFNASVFPQVQFLPGLKEKVLYDMLDPEFTIEEPNGLIRKWAHKYRRWKGNRWKQKLCYDESAWRAFWNGMMVHLMKPKAN